MDRFLIVVMSAAILSIAVPARAGVGSKQAQYDGGAIAKIPKKMKGKLVTGKKDLRFEYKQTGYPIPYSAISARVAQTAAVAVCGSCADPWKEPRTSEPEDRATGRPAGIATLFIHAKHHFLTLEFTRNGAKQAAVFEIGKAMPLTLLPVLEAKTGKKVEYQSKKK